MTDHDPLPEELTELASIHISLVMESNGIGTSFTYDGLSLESAIGHMTIVLDRMREEAAAQWATCPACGDGFAEEDE